ncbi:hypothetical protein LY76DRAFT_416988 [Colletotrichum caudatum]|nr:hypothetical protein LY76DRAFT_416988 [Colletotrichum caudatum]
MSVHRLHTALRCTHHHSQVTGSSIVGEATPPRLRLCETAHRWACACVLLQGQATPRRAAHRMFKSLPAHLADTMYGVYYPYTPSLVRGLGGFFFGSGTPTLLASWNWGQQRRMKMQCLHHVDVDGLRIPSLFLFYHFL